MGREGGQTKEKTVQINPNSTMHKLNLAKLLNGTTQVTWGGLLGALPKALVDPVID